MELQTADDQGQPEVGVARMKEFLAQKVKFVVGPALSTVSIAMEPFWGTSDAIFVIAGGSEPHLTDGRPNVFSTAFRHTELAKGAVWYFRKHETGYSKAAVIADQTSTTLGQIYQETFVSEWKAQGGTITTVVYTKGQDQTDFYPQLTAVLNSKPDMVASAQTYKPNASSIKQARQLGLTVPFISTAGGAPQEADIAGDSINGNYETAGVSLDTLITQGNPDAKALADAYQKTYNQPLTDLVGTFSNMYTAIYAISRAIKAAGSATDVKSLKNAMYKVKISDLPKVVSAKYGAESTGALFDSTGWAHLKTAILIWKDKKIQLAAVSP
jgi:branched-chain amino acid transport system substrate-binding protein